MSNPANYTIDELQTACLAETANYRARKDYDPATCLEIFRRALHHQINAARDALNVCYFLTMRAWFYQYRFWQIIVHNLPGDDITHHSIRDDIIQRGFMHFFEYNDRQVKRKGTPLAIKSLSAILALLHICLLTVIAQERRRRQHSMLTETPLDDDIALPWPDPEQAVMAQERQRKVWDAVHECIAAAQQPGIDVAQALRIVHMRFVEHLMPHTIAEQCPELGLSADEISRFLRNFRDRFRRMFKDPDIFS